MFVMPAYSLKSWWNCSTRLCPYWTKLRLQCSYWISKQSKVFEYIIHGSEGDVTRPTKVMRGQLHLKCFWINSSRESCHYDCTYSYEEALQNKIIRNFRQGFRSLQVLNCKLLSCIKKILQFLQLVFTIMSVNKYWTTNIDVASFRTQF